MEINAGDDDDGDDSPSLLLPHNLREGTCDNDDSYGDPLVMLMMVKSVRDM